MFKNKFMLVLPLLLLIGCSVSVGPTQTESRSVELGNVDSVRVGIQMGVGELNVEGGATNLMDAEFTYNIEAWRPTVEYAQRGDIGELQIAQPSGEINGIPDDEVNYQWDIALQNDVPMDMDVDLGVGESHLTLSGLALQNLLVNTGVGEATIDLSGNWQDSFDATIKGGVGETTIYLPDRVGLRVEANTGLGELVIVGLQREGDSDVYTNDAYGESAVTISLTVDGGIGKITVQAGK
ncbi:MAG: hypothetical protein H6657_31645 [Ardenticatenaceae bacterium]|nr:hypothetical protein [Anaerolineales bacterium]MCB8981985.1 hypothetical protein [Ardenticatenaceae bacterium]